MDRKKRPCGLHIMINKEHISIDALLDEMDEIDIFDESLDQSCFSPIVGCSKCSLFVFGNLWMNDCPRLEWLPQKLTVLGSLDISRTAVSRLPPNLIVGQDLFLGGTQVATIPGSIRVGGRIYVDDVEAISCPPELRDRLAVHDDEMAGMVKALYRADRLRVHPAGRRRFMEHGRQLRQPLIENSLQAAL